MKLRIAMGTLCLLALATMPASAQTNIDDIQVYDNLGAPNSPFNATSVTIRGRLTTLKGTYNSGTYYIQDATGGMNFFDPGAPNFALGDSIEVTGTIGSFGGEINIGSNVYSFIQAGTVPAPLEITVAEYIDFDGSGTVTAGDYEHIGFLAAVEGFVVSRPGIDVDLNLFWDQGTIGLANALGDTATIFIDNTTGIETGGINAGDEFRFIGPMANFNGLIEMKPRFQADVIENPGNPFPVIQNVTPNPWTPEANQAVTINADISDNGTLVDVSLFFRDRGAVPFTSTPMFDTGGGLYAGSIPGTTAAGIEYYLSATDDAAQVTLIPGDAPTGFSEIAVGTTSIVTIQSTLQPGTDISALSGQLVNVEAIVTGAPGELQVGGLSNYNIGEAAGGPWSGIFIFEGSGSNVLFRGDKIRISGTVSEFNGITELIPQNGTSIEVVSFGNALPPVPVLSTSVLDTSEAWESVIVATMRATVTDTIFGGAEWSLTDGVSDSSLYCDPAPGVSIVALLGEDMWVTGMLDTRFGRNEIVPIDNSFVIPASAVAAPAVGRVRAAHFESIIPNPFNPKTSIKFSLERAGKVELALFNSRGRRVATLASGDLEAGAHERTWSGLDDSGAQVSSGVYFARLRFELESYEVQKLTLTK